MLLHALVRCVRCRSSTSRDGGDILATIGNQWMMHYAGLSSSAAPTGAGGGAAAPAPQQPHPVDESSLTPEQARHLATLRYLALRPLQSARSAALLTGLAARSRDLFVSMDQMHKKDILGIPRPLMDEPPPPPPPRGSSSSSEANAHGVQSEGTPQPAPARTQMFYPVRDLSKLPDQPPPPGGWLRNHLSDRYMTRDVAFCQLLPNHMEVSYQTRTQIMLWPPMESYLPGYVDAEAARRYLAKGLKRRRNTRSKRLQRVRCSLGAPRIVPYHSRWARMPR